jgi:FKBP-type peptidyl-prolyl cis-trans isomerase FklB
MLLAVCMILSSAAFAAEEGGAQPAAENGAAEPPLVLKSDKDKVSYLIGMQIAESLRAQGIELNTEILFRAMEDVLLGRTPLLSEDEARQVMADYQKRMTEARSERMKQESEKNNAEGAAFLNESKTKPGVVVLPSGLQYKVVEDGEGATPSREDRVKVHYRGTLVNGEEFDSSYSRGKPAEFGVTQVIKGWTEALLLMQEGSKWQLFIPFELAYGEGGRPPTIPPSSVLVFDVELIEVLTPPAAE